MDKVKKNPKEFVADLVKERAKNDSTGLPEFPSAQMWGNMSDSDKVEFQSVVEKTGTKWKDYKQEMLGHHPMKANWRTHA